MKLPVAFRSSRIGILVAGDVIAFVAWAVLGLASHRMAGDWLFNVVRVVAPFLIGWFVVAPFTGAYHVTPAQQPGAFLLRSALAWLLGVSLALLLRATLFGSGFVPVFALVTFGVTGLLVLGWRVVYLALARFGPTMPRRKQV